MSNQPPLNPDALTSNPELFMVASTHHFHSDECLCGFKSARSRDRTEHIMLHTLAAAQPVAQKITDAEWQAFQAIPDQGYSHRSWVDARIAERVAVAQLVVNSVEELITTRAGLALANAAFNEGLSAGIRACNESLEGEPFVKPVSPYRSEVDE